MDIIANDEKLSRLTNPGPDDQLREILKGSDFEDYKSPLFIACAYSALVDSVTRLDANHPS